MRMMILIFTLISFSAAGQYVKELKKDSAIKPAAAPSVPIKPDSVLTYPDTLIIKIPALLAPTFAAYMNGTETEVILAYYKELMRQLAPQIKRQFIKKPKK